MGTHVDCGMRRWRTARLESLALILALTLTLGACGSEPESEVGDRSSESESASESESGSESGSESESESESESGSDSESRAASASEAARCLPVELCGCPLGCTRVTGAIVGARVRGEAGSTCGLDHEVLELSTPDGPALVLQPIAPGGASCARQCRARRRGPSACVDQCDGCEPPNRELWYQPPPEDPVVRETRERFGSQWDTMSDRQRRCHVDAARAGRPAQIGDGTCESLL